MTPGAAAGAVAQTVEREVQITRGKISARMMRAANELRNSALDVLANPSPSAPGSPPGVRSGDLRRNWTPFAYGLFGDAGTLGITSGMHYAGYLENGTYKMAARPFVDKIQEEAAPKIEAIFSSI